MEVIFFLLLVVLIIWVAQSRPDPLIVILTIVGAILLWLLLFGGIPV